MHNRILTIVTCLFITISSLCAGRKEILAHIKELEARREELGDDILRASGERGESKYDMRYLRAQEKTLNRRIAEAKERLRHCDTE